MAAKQFARSHLGGTRFWRWLTILRHYWDRFRKSPRWRRSFYRILPKRVIYNMMQNPDFYSQHYFDVPKDPTRESGYDIPYVDQEHFREVSTLVRDFFQAGRVLEMGCARGWQVLALQEMGIESWGIDISEYAVKTAPAEVAVRLSVCGCQRTPFPDDHFDMVLLMETLEHIPPDDLDRSIAEARRVANRWVWASMPSMGGNPYGPDGNQGDSGILERYHRLYEDGVIDLAPFRHIARDIYGAPHHGHLIIASFDWWTEAFTRHGLVRRGDIERKINKEVFRASHCGLNCYVFAKASDPAGAAPRTMPACWPWERVDEHAWRTGVIELPPGLHRAGCSLRVRDGGMRMDRLYQAMTVRCVSSDGEAILGLRTFTRHGIARAAWNGGVDVNLPCACDEAREVRLEMRCSPGFRAGPLGPGRATLYASAGTAAQRSAEIEPQAITWEAVEPITPGAPVEGSSPRDTDTYSMITESAESHRQEGVWHALPRLREGSAGKRKILRLMRQ